MWRQVEVDVETRQADSDTCSSAAIVSVDAKLGVVTLGDGTRLDRYDFVTGGWPGIQVGRKRPIDHTDVGKLMRINGDKAMFGADVEQAITI